MGDLTRPVEIGQALRGPRGRRTPVRRDRLAFAALWLALSAAPLSAQVAPVTDQKTNKQDGMAHKLRVGIAMATEITTYTIRMGQKIIKTFHGLRENRDIVYNALRLKVGERLVPKGAAVTIAATDNDLLRDATIVKKLSTDYFDRMFPAERQVALLAADVLEVAVEAQMEAELGAKRADAFAKMLNEDGLNDLPMFSSDSALVAMTNGEPAPETVSAAVDNRLGFLRRAAWGYATEAMPLAPPMAALFAQVDPPETLDSDVAWQRKPQAVGRKVLGSAALCKLPSTITKAPETVTQRIAVAARTGATVSKATEAKIDAAQARLETVETARQSDQRFHKSVMHFLLAFSNPRRRP